MDNGTKVRLNVQVMLSRVQFAHDGVCSSHLTCLLRQLRQPVKTRGCHFLCRADVVLLGCLAERVDADFRGGDPGMADRDDYMRKKKRKKRLQAREWMGMGDRPGF